MIISILRYLKNELNKLKYKNKNVRFFNGTKIDSNCFFEGYNSIGEKSILKNCYVGLGTYIGANTILSSVKIGRFCSLASNIDSINGQHPTSTFVSTHPAFFSPSKAAGFSFSGEKIFKEIVYLSESYTIIIGNDVWIGQNVSILQGVKIGDGAIIGANSLVTRDVEPYSINIGTPAKIIKYRFDDESIEFLLKFKWWEKNFEWLQKNYLDFKDINLFKKKYKDYYSNNNE